MCKLSGVWSRIHHWVERSVIVELVVLVTQRACEALCTADPGCRGAAYRTSDQNCGLFDSGTSQEYSGCLACTGFAKQCPTGNYPVTRQTCDVSTYTIYAANLVSSATYSSVMPTTHTACQSMCTADQYYLGFAFNALTGECELSDSTVPKYLVQNVHFQPEIVLWIWPCPWNHPTMTVPTLPLARICVRMTRFVCRFTTVKVTFSAICRRQTNLPLDVTRVNFTPKTAYQVGKCIDLLKFCRF